MKVDRYVDLTFAAEIVLVAAGGIAGSYAWSPPEAGAVAGVILGYVASYVLDEILDRLFVIYSDPERLDRELADRDRAREARRRKKR